MTDESRSRKAFRSEGSRLLAMLMEKNEWSQTEVARRIGVSEPAVGRWLRGERMPDVRSLAKMDFVLDVPARTWGLPIVSTPTKAA